MLQFPQVTVESRFTVKRFSEYLKWILLFVAGVMALHHFLLLCDISVWRHDSLYYIGSYDDKLRTEGRWLNYALYHWLKLIPPPVAIFVSFGAIFYFLYTCSIKVNKDWKYAALLGLMLIQLPLLRVQMEWPETILPAYLFLAIAARESARMSPYLFFPLFSVLFFSSYSGFYFLLPLLFLDKLSPATALRLLLLWIACFVLGYLFSNLVVYSMVGETIQMSDWRHPNPVRSWADLVVNTKKVLNSLIIQSKSFLDTTRVQSTLTAACLWALFGGLRSLKLPSLILAIPATLAVYVTVIPYGIVISARTTGVFWMAVLLWIFIHNRQNIWYGMVGVLLLATVGLKLGESSRLSTQWYHQITDAIREDVSRAIHYHPHEVAWVYVLMSPAEVASVTRTIELHMKISPVFSEPINSAHGIAPMVKSLGYRQVHLCYSEENWGCAEAYQHLRARLFTGDERGAFIATQDASRNIILTINPGFVAP